MKIKQYAIIYADNPDKLNEMINLLVLKPENYALRLYGNPFTYNGPCGFRICQTVVEEDPE
jgi:hypothetical protein